MSHTVFKILLMVCLPVLVAGVAACSGQPAVDPARIPSASAVFSPLLVGAGAGWPASGSVGGELSVWQDSSTLYVQFACADGWSFAGDYDELGVLQENVHLYVGASLPSSVNPGRFPYRRTVEGSTICTFELPLADLESADYLYIAGHAMLQQSGSGAGSAWAFDITSAGEDDGVSANEAGWFSNLGLSSKWGWVLHCAVEFPVAPGWRMWGGNPQRTFRADWAAGPAQGVERWTYQTGGTTYASPAVAPDGSVLIHAGDGYMYALNADGSLKWRTLVGSGPAYCSPAVADDGTVYFGTTAGKVFALNADGSNRWTLDAAGPFGGIFYGAALLDGQGRLYLHDDDGRLYVIAADGSLQWTYSSGGSGGPPAIGADGQTCYYFANYRLQALDADGGMVWQTGSLGGTPRSTVAVGPAALWFGVQPSDYVGQLYNFDLNGNFNWSVGPGQAVDSSVSLQADGGGVLGFQGGRLRRFAADGTLLWDIATGGQNVESCPLTDREGVIYLATTETLNFVALNPDGTQKWSVPIGLTSCSPAIATDGTLYIPTWNGVVHAIGD